MADIPPIPKNNFNLYIKKLSDDEDLYLGINNIIVSSHDWKGKRSWQGKIENGEDENTFDFDKDLTGKFWEFVKFDKLPLHTPTDIMVVQLIYRPNNKIKYRIIRVIKYNKMDIDKPLNDDEISKITCAVGKNKTDELNVLQTDFFDKLDNTI